MVDARGVADDPAYRAISLNVGKSDIGIVGSAHIDVMMFTRSRSAAIKRALHTERQKRWRANARTGRRIVQVAIDGQVLEWLSRNYSGRFDPNSLDSVGALVSEILKIAAADL
jgi:hypothetical protein